MNGLKETNRKHKLSAEDSLSKRATISVSKPLARLFGRNVATIYCELVSRHRYFDLKGKLEPDGSFFNTREDLQRGTELGDKPQRIALSSLQELGLIRVDLRGIPAKRYFKIIDTPKLDEYLDEGERLIKKDYQKETPSITQKANLELPEGSVNNTNINNTNNKTSPPSAEEVETYEDRMKKWEESDTSNELYEGFLGVDTPVEPPKDHKPSKTLQKKIVAGEYERINSRDITEYFRNKYIIKYKRYPNNPSDIKKTLAILKVGFLDKYGGKLALELIDLLFEHYEIMDIDRSKYPRPEYSSLTQDWLMNKLLDRYAQSLKYSREEEEVWVPSDWNKNL